jgi:hypothetical protein
MVGRGWVGVGFGVALFASACGPEEGPEEEVTAFGYEQCTTDVGPPSCVGLDCAADQVARGALELMLQIVADRGYTDAFTPVYARNANGADGSILVDYQLHVEWMRTSDRIDMDLPASEAELRAELEDHIDDWDVPERLVEPADIVEAVESCEPLLEIDPCTDFEPGFMVRTGREEELSDCRVRYTTVMVDARTAGVDTCTVDEQVDCG